MNAPSTFKRMMDHVLAEIDFARVYLGDFVVFSTNLEELWGHVSAVTRAITKDGLSIKLAKCHPA